MKKVFALLLCAVMMLSVLTVGASAAAPITLNDLIEMARSHGRDTVYLPYDMAVNESTVIPEGFTVIVPTTRTIDINQPVTVKGNLIIDGFMTTGSNTNLDIDDEGVWSYSRLTNVGTTINGHDVYRWEYNCNHYNHKHCTPDCFAPIYPSAPIYPTIPVCSAHNTQYAFCTACDKWHCPYCLHNVVVPENNPVLSFRRCEDCTARMTYCQICDDYYCDNCDTHRHYSSIYPNYYPISVNVYCYAHGHYKTYCGYCGTHYCTSCYPEAHAHTGYVVNGSYIYYPGYGYVYSGSKTVKAPEANVSSGVVKAGTKVYLSSDTEDATIYYTTNGTVPTTRSAKYTGAITITKDTTIRAIAVKRYMTTSEIVSFKYTVLRSGSFTDTSKYDGLDEALATLLKAGIIDDAKKFNPEGTFTYEELTDILAVFGIDMDEVGLDTSVFEDKEALSNDDFVYITYRALRTYDLIDAPKSKGSTTIKKLSHYDEIPDAALYRAAYVSFLENGMFYDINITPSNDARRVDLAIAIAEVVENIG